MKGGARPVRRFDNVEKNDTVYHIVYGESIVGEVHADEFSITNKAGEFWITKEGHDSRLKGWFPENPIVLWNPFKLPDIEKDVRPFSLIKLLEQNLTPVSFEGGKENQSIFLRHTAMDGDLRWKRGVSWYEEWLTVYFTDEQSINFVIEQLNEHKVTRKELFKAYQTLGWL